MQRGSSSRLWFALAAIALCQGCGDDLILLPGDLPHAISMFTCGPADGPAVRILIAERPIASLTPPPPYASIYIDGSIDALQPGTYTMPKVGAGWWESATEFESATSGGVEITSVTADHTISGTVTLRFPSHTVTGPFVAPWRTNPITCP